MNLPDAPRAAREGDDHARAILADAGLALARGLGNVVSLLNPERIILGGRFVEAGDLLVEPLEASPAALMPCGKCIQGLEVPLGRGGESSAFLGIAAHVRERLFAYPSVGARFEETGRRRRPLIESETKSMRFARSPDQSQSCGSSRAFARGDHLLPGPARASHYVTLTVTGEDGQHGYAGRRPPRSGAARRPRPRSGYSKTASPPNSSAPELAHPSEAVAILDHRSLR